MAEFPVVDPDRLGGIGWLERTQGRLTAAEQRRLVAVILRAQVDNVAVRSAQRVREVLAASGASDGDVEAVRDAISVHTLPGVSVHRDGALGTYLQAGAMLDLVGLRAWDIPGAGVQTVTERHPPRQPGAGDHPRGAGRGLRCSRRAVRPDHPVGIPAGHQSRPHGLTRPQPRADEVAGHHRVCWEPWVSQWPGSSVASSELT